MPEVRNRPPAGFPVRPVDGSLSARSVERVIIVARLSNAPLTQTGASTMKQTRVDGSVISSSAAGAYWKELRRARGLTQAQLCEQLFQAFCLRVAIKQLWAWEKGVQRPSCVARAALTRVLEASATQTDELLLYDEQMLPTINAVLTDVNTVQARQLANQCAAHGKETARRWLQSRQRRLQRGTAYGVPPEKMDEVETLHDGLQYHFSFVSLRP